MAEMETSAVEEFKVVVDASTDTAALSNPSATATRPSSGVIKVDHAATARIQFGGTDAEDEAVNYQVILWHRLQKKLWVPMIMAKGAYTLGAATIPTPICASGGYYADSITENLALPGSVLRQEADDSIASLDIDTREADLLQIETDLATAAAAYVFVQAGKRPSTAMDIDVEGTGLATSSAQTTGNNSLSAMAADLTQLNAFTASGKTIEDLEQISIAQAAAGTVTIHADDAGFHYYLMGLWGTVTVAATTIQLREADDAPVYGGPLDFNDKNGLVMPVTGFPYLITADGKGLEMNCVTGGFNGTAIILKVAN